MLGGGGCEGGSVGDFSDVGVVSIYHWLNLSSVRSSTQVPEAFRRWVKCYHASHVVVVINIASGFAGLKGPDHINTTYSILSTYLGRIESQAMRNEQREILAVANSANRAVYQSRDGKGDEKDCI